MANSNEKEQKKEEQVEKNQELHTSEQSPRQNDNSAPKNRSFISGLSIVIAIIATALALWAIQSNNQLQKKLLDEKANLWSKVNQLKQDQENNQQQIDEKAVTIQQTQSTLQKRIDSLNKQIQTAMNQKLYQNQDWLLLKTRHYLELAQINAHWSDNFNAAISLLQQADKLLEQLHAPQILDIRQAIAKEIAQLKAIPTVDITGLLSKIDAAQTSVNNLTSQTAKEAQEATPDTTATKEATSSTWHTHLQDSFKLLGKLIVIRRENENIKPLISPFYESIIKESIRLNLQEAQWAVLNNNPAVYQLALKQAEMNIKRSFNQSTTNTEALIKQLEELQKINIVQEKPVIELALPLLNQLIDNKELIVNSTNDSGKGGN